LRFNEEPAGSDSESTGDGTASRLANALKKIRQKAAVNYEQPETG
jgi:hypothetical protein